MGGIRRRLSSLVIMVMAMATVPSPAQADGTISWTHDFSCVFERGTHAGQETIGYVEVNARIESRGRTGARRFRLRFEYEWGQWYDGAPWVYDRTVTRTSATFPNDGQTRYFSSGERFYFTNPSSHDSAVHRVKVIATVDKRNLLGQLVQMWSEHHDNGDSCRGPCWEVVDCTYQLAIPAARSRPSFSPTDPAGYPAILPGIGTAGFYQDLIDRLFGLFGGGEQEGR